MSVFFNGRLIVSPATASLINDSALQPQSTSVGNVVALVGRASGGAPKTVLRFGSPQEAALELVSGELLDAVRAAFNPSPETGGPDTVVVVRVNPAVQATGVLKDAGNNTVVNLTSLNYGQRENQIQFKVEAGSVSGLRVTTQRGQEYYTKDNIERRAFSIRYSGSEATATLTVTASTATLYAPAGTAVATIDLAQYTTVVSVVDRINAVAGFSATVLDTSFDAPAYNGLDFITAQDVKTADYVVKGNLQAVVDWLNGPTQAFVRATRATNVGTVPAVVGWTFLSGGSDGVTTFTDWSDAFTVLQTVDVQWVTPVSSDSAVHALADTHASYMSDVALRERRVICGTALGTTDTQAIAAAKGLNSKRTSLVHIGHYNYNSAGALTLFPPYMTAALISGAFSGVNPGTPLTNKAIQVRGLERNLRNPTDTDVLINGGVFCVESTDDGYKVVKSITTWLKDRNYAKVEQSTGAALDYVARTVRRELDVLRGAKGGPISLQRAVSIAESALRNLAKPEPQGPGVLVGDAQSPAYRNISAQLNGDVLKVQFECSPAIPVNYVLVSIFAVPYSGTAVAS